MGTCNSFFPEKMNFLHIIQTKKLVAFVKLVKIIMKIYLIS